MRKPSVLYLGLEAPSPCTDAEVIHYPIIRIVASPLSNSDIVSFFQKLPYATHLIVTSKTAASLFSSALAHFSFSATLLQDKEIIAIGKKTAKRLNLLGLPATSFATKETAEGIIELLQTMDLKKADLFWPHSALARPLLSSFFQRQQIRYAECILYETLPRLLAEGEALPSLAAIDEIIFTSPSCVDAFLALFGFLPKEKKMTSIGPITRAYLDQKLQLIDI